MGVGGFGLSVTRIIAEKSVYVVKHNKHSKET